MQFHSGAPPENPSFQTDTDGWAPIKEPSMAVVQLLAVPVAGVILIALGLWVGAVGGLGVDLLSRASFIQLGIAVLLIPVLFFLHEVAHAIVHPGWGGSSKTILGFWPKYLSFYAHYDEEMKRERFLVCFLTPLVLLSVIPMLVMSVTGLNPILTVLVFANAMGAAGDLIGFSLILVQVPRGATVRNQGWRTFWRHPGNAL